MTIASEIAGLFDGGHVGNDWLYTRDGEFLEDVAEARGASVTVRSGTTVYTFKDGSVIEWDRDAEEWSVVGEA